MEGRRDPGTAGSTALAEAGRVTGQYTQAWGDATAGRAAALKKLWEFAYREVQVQAFADAFLMIAVCFVLSAMMVPLMRNGTTRAATS